MSNVPADLKYTREHEWVRVEADGTLTVGITDYAQRTLGDIVFVELPQVGKKMEAGDPVGVVESVKAATEFFSPVAGEVIAVNEEATEDPEDNLDRLRVRLTPQAARAFIDRARRVVSAGRPPCPLCGQPLDPGGHLCPRHNGYHR